MGDTKQQTAVLQAELAEIDRRKAQVTTKLDQLTKPNLAQELNQNQGELYRQRNFLANARQRLSAMDTDTSRMSPTDRESINEPGRHNFERRKQIAREQMAIVSGEINGLEEKVADLLTTIARIQKTINANPVYRATLATRAEFVEKAKALALETWRCPFAEVPARIRSLESLMDREAQELIVKNSELTAAGLPTVPPKIRSFFGMIVPMFALGIDVEELHSQARAKISEMGV